MLLALASSANGVRAAVTSTCSCHARRRKHQRHSAPPAASTDRRGEAVPFGPQANPPSLGQHQGHATVSSRQQSRRRLTTFHCNAHARADDRPTARIANTHLHRTPFGPAHGPPTKANVTIRNDECAAKRRIGTSYRRQSASTVASPPGTSQHMPPQPLGPRADRPFSSPRATLPQKEPDAPLPPPLLLYRSHSSRRLTPLLCAGTRTGASPSWAHLPP